VNEEDTIRDNLGRYRQFITRYGLLDPDLPLHPEASDDLPEWTPQNMQDRWDGKSWPMTAETMIGLRRMINLESCLDGVRLDKVPGDFAECGVWRGGASIFAALYFQEWAVDKHVWAFDSYEGLPEGSYPRDENSRWHEWNNVFAVDLERVSHNFQAYHIPENAYSLRKGWFHDSLPKWIKAEGRPLSVLRVDADMYEGTYDSLYYLYPYVSSGGMVIIDDYNLMNACKDAVDQFRSESSIEDKIIEVDHTAIVWRKS